MKKRFFLAILMVAVIVMFASLAFAGVNQDTTVTTGDNSLQTTVTANPTATGGTGIGTGGNATATGGNAKQKQDQKQKQQQKQNQTQKQKTTVTGVNGSQSVSTPLQAQLLGAIVGPGGAEIGKEFMLRCDPAYQLFTIEELENMSNSGKFFDKRGSFFDAMFSEKVKAKVRSKKVRDEKEPTKNSIRILNEVPVNTKVLGTFSCTGDYGWGLDEVLSKCLLTAREKTNTANVVVYQTNDIDAANSGTATGAGTGISDAYGSGNVGAGAVGASFGKTHSMKERVILLEVFAYDDVVEASDVCGGPQQQFFTPEINVPAPEIAPAPKAKCGVKELNELRKQVEKNYLKIYGDRRTKKAGCEKYCKENLKLRAERQKLFYAIFKCTGDQEALSEVFENSEKAANNYKFGWDIEENQAEAEKIMAQVFKIWASANEEGGK